MKTIEKILEIAYTIFAEQGYEKASMSNIANEVGISKAALYHHFKSKEEIFETLYDYILKEMKIKKTIKYKDCDELKTILIAKGIEDINYQINNPLFAKIIKQFYLLGLRNEKFEEKNKLFESAVRENYNQIFKHALVKGLFDQEQVDMTIDLLMLVDNSISEEIIKNGHKNYIKLWTESVHRLVR